MWDVSAAPPPSGSSDGPVDPILRELARWAGGIPANADAVVAEWSTVDWNRFRRQALMHGLAAFFAAWLREAPGAAVVPPDVQGWLEEQERRVAERADRLRADLAAVLERAAALGIEVMPLKGALLLDDAAIDWWRRPMADLDLLVRPDQRMAMRSVLLGLGYKRRRRPETGPKPESYVPRSGAAVVDRAGEHPDNPRPVEVHVAVQRHLWEWTHEDRLTGALWASAGEGIVAGQPAIVPSRERLFEHVAVHATANLMRGRGRLVQWLDLAGLAAAGAAPRGGPEAWIEPRLAYPSLALASRVLPGMAAAVDLDALAAASPDVVVRWARDTQLDGRAGLETGAVRMPPAGRSSRDHRAERWRPSRLRLAVAYGDSPLPEALGRLSLAVVRYGLGYGQSQARWRASRRLGPWIRRIRGRRR